MRYHTRSLLLVGAVSVIAAVASSVPAAASATVFVSRSGSNAPNCGSVSTPCQDLTYALANVVDPGGSILILDSAYVSNAISISKSVSIINQGGTVTIQRTVANYGVRISAGATGKVVLKGLNVDGIGVGTIGIDVLSAGSVDVIDCLVRNFTGDGIKLEPNTALKYNITNTSVLDNGANGISVGPRPGGSAVGSIVNAESLRNGYAGILVDGSGGGTALATIHGTRSNFNAGPGFHKYSDGSFYLATSMATGNATNIGSSGGGGPGYSYQNNFLLGNTSDTGAGFLTNVSQQ